MEKQQELSVELNKRAPSFLESGEWTDCKFVVGAEPHQVVVGGYKLVMAMASPVFEAMFYGSLAETTDHITIADVEPEIFKAMLRYLYTGNINISSCSEAIQLFYTAKKYMLHHLMEKCSNYLNNNLNVANVCQLYEHSQLHEDKVLTQKCIDIFSEKIKELLQENSFKNAALSTVEKIFSLDEMNIDSEVDLINAAAQYASAQDKNIVEKESSIIDTNTTTTHEKELNVENDIKRVIQTQKVSDSSEQASSESSDMKDTVDKQPIRSVVKHIRLLTLTPQQYADCTARSSLLTPSEDYAVILNMASNKPGVPMPSGLSKSKDRRYKVGTFSYTVQNFRSLNKDVESPVFYLQNLLWYMKIRPKKTYEEEPKYLSGFICCKANSESSNWSCDAKYQLRLICHKPGAKNFVMNGQNLFKGFVHSGRGWDRMISWDTVLDPKFGYIQDDAVTFEVQIAAKEPQGDI